MFTFILTAAPVSSIQFIIADAFSAALLKKRQNHANDFVDDHYDDDACHGEYDGNHSVHNCDT